MKSFKIIEHRLVTGGFRPKTGRDNMKDDLPQGQVTDLFKRRRRYVPVFGFIIFLAVAGAVIFLDVSLRSAFFDIASESGEAQPS